MQSNESRTELIITQKSWEDFLVSLENFISVHQRSLNKLRELNERNKALRLELRGALALRPMLFPEASTGVLEGVCKFCGSDIPMDARFCDRCGRKQTEISSCVCGRELSLGDRFCDRCGRTRAP
jgi:predicted amidophosphoribosyltransferase